MDRAAGRDAAVRMAAFKFLETELEKTDELTLPFDELRRGFDFDGRRVPLLGPQGIFKPAVLSDFFIMQPTIGTSSGSGPISTSRSGPTFSPKSTGRCFSMGSRDSRGRRSWSSHGGSRIGQIRVISKSVTGSSDVPAEPIVRYYRARPSRASAR